MPSENERGRLEEPWNQTMKRVAVLVADHLLEGAVRTVHAQVVPGHHEVDTAVHVPCGARAAVGHVHQGGQPPQGVEPWHAAGAKMPHLRDETVGRGLGRMANSRPRSGFITTFSGWPGVAGCLKKVVPSWLWTWHQVPMNRPLMLTCAVPEWAILKSAGCVRGGAAPALHLHGQVAHGHDHESAVRPVVQGARGHVCRSRRWARPCARRGAGAARRFRASSTTVQAEGGCMEPMRTWCTQPHVAGRAF